MDRIYARYDGLESFIENGFSEDRRGGGAVAGDIACLAGDFLNHLGTHVFEGVLKFDFLGNRHAVFGDGGRAEGFLQNDITAFGAQGDFDRTGQFADATTHRIASFLIKGDHFGHVLDSFYSFEFRVVSFELKRRENRGSEFLAPRNSLLTTNQ